MTNDEIFVTKQNINCYMILIPQVFIVIRSPMYKLMVTYVRAGVHKCMLSARYVSTKV